MRRLLLLVLASLPAAAAEPIDGSTHTALIWQGFTHHWSTRNHRVNRIGDYIRGQSCTDTGCSAKMGHTAASGSSNDTAFFNSYYAKVTSASVNFFDASTSLYLRGSEGDPINLVKTVNIGLPASMRGRNATVLLNGFDIQAVANLDSGVTDADKLRQLDIAVSDGVWDPSTGLLRLTVSVYFIAACQSVECDWANTDLDYRLTVYLLAVSGDGADFRGDGVGLAQVGSYPWNGSTELTPNTVGALQSHEVRALPAPALTHSLLGLKRIRVALDDDHWLLQWDHFLRKTGYDPATGVLHYLSDMFWKSWRPGMDIGALRESGEATLQMAPWLLRFRDACVQDFEQPHSGSMAFDANGGAAGSDSVHEDDFPFGPAAAICPSSGPVGGDFDLDPIGGIDLQIPDSPIIQTAPRLP